MTTAARPSEAGGDGREERPGPPEAEMPANLTPRQREILYLLGRGIRVREIAASLGLSDATVRNHIRGLLLRTGCHSQLEVVARAREWRLP